MQDIKTGVTAFVSTTASAVRGDKVNTQSDNSEDEKKQMHILEQTIQRLPEEPENLPEGILEVPLVTIENAVKTHVEETSPISGKVIEGKEHFSEVLNELDRLKDKLGGSPNFRNEKPSLDDPDAHKTFLKIPMPAVKDWFRMVLNNNWIPKSFWKAVAKSFNVTTENNNSQYENAHIRIQRFGLLIANKERIIEILKSGDRNRFSEFSQITGLAWHPQANGIGTEKIYIEFIEKFLTEDFEAAKKKGDDALVEYFNAFKGVCFEDRCRILEQFSTEHSTDVGIQALDNIIDIDFNKPVRDAFSAVAGAVAEKNTDVNPKVLLEEVRKNDLFNKEFLVEDGDGKAKPTLQDFQNYCLTMIDAWVVEPYSTIEDFLHIELELLKNSGLEVNADNFKARLQKIDGREIIGEDRDSFNVNDSAVGEFINKNIV